MLTVAAPVLWCRHLLSLVLLSATSWTACLVQILLPLSWMFLAMLSLSVLIVGSCSAKVFSVRESQQARGFEGNVGCSEPVDVGRSEA